MFSNSVSHVNILAPQHKEKILSDNLSLQLSEKEKIDEENPTKINPEELPDFNFFTGGFPCQPFSCSGNKKGFKDKRGGMIFKLLDLCKLYKPQTIILENVSNLLTLEKGEIISKIQNIFEENNISHCNFLKLDCEGAEYEILCNLPTKYFKKIDKIVMECHFVDKKPELIDRLKQILAKQGFQVVAKAISNELVLLYAIKDGIILC